MANLRFSPGLLSSIRDFGADLAGSQAGARNALTGAGAQPASLGGMLARNVGTMLGRDMRTPQEKLQAELTQVKNPLSAEGMLQRAQIIAANSTDPQSLQVAATLATEARNIKKAQTDKERAEKAREGDLKFLEENEEYRQYVDDYESFSVGSEFVAKLRQEQVAEEAAKRAAGLSKKQRTRVFTTLGKLYDVPKKDQTAIEAGDFSDLTSEQFKDLFKPENQKAETVNFEVALDPVGFATTGKTGGTVVRALSQREDGKVLDPKDRKWKEINEVGILRKTKAVEKEEGVAPEVDTKQAFMAQAQGATLNIAKQLSGLNQLEKAAVLGAASTPIRTAALVQTKENLGKKAGQVSASTRRIVQAVARELSGAAIKIDEQEDFRQLLVPTLADFGDNDLIFTKLANNYVGFAIANQSGYVKNTKDEAQGKANASVLKDSLADLAAQPVTPEIQKLVDEGRFEEALEMRKNQLLGSSEDEITIESLRAKYG